jgi:hypothetical protein
MKKKLGPVEKFRPLWEGGKSVEQYNIKVGFKIRMFVVQELNTLRQKNPNLFGPKETEDLTKMIMDLKQDKGTISPEDQTCALEDYQMFLQEFFQKVDYEDRHGTVTMKTTSKFRLMASFIDVLASWGPIDEEMIKCKKYCQFKAVDIFKALKKGEVPKRGGPKEQDNQDAGLGNEIDELAKNMGDANLGNHNQNQGGNFQQQMPNNQYGGNNPYGGQQQYNQQVNNNQFNNPYGNPNQNNINQQNNAGFSNPFGNQNNYNNNMNNNYNQGMYQQPPQHQPPQHQPPQHQYPQQYPQQQYQQPQQNKYNPQPQYQNQQGQGGMNKVRKSKVFPSNDKKDPQKRVFKGKYELDAKIPIKYNSVDYFMLVENVRINNEAALREFKRGKASDILNMVLDSLEFLSYIHK